MQHQQVDKNIFIDNKDRSWQARLQNQSAELSNFKPYTAAARLYTYLLQ